MNNRLSATLISLLFSVASFAQPNVIHGAVVDSDIKPVFGVSVQETGTENTTVVDSEGKFQISVDDGASLKFSCSGYSTRTVPARDSMVVILYEETVSVGYATGRKRSMSGTVERVKAEDMNSGYVATAIDAIRGKVPGLVILESGSVNSDPVVRLRGTSSLTGGNDPLVVIDGVFSSLAALQEISAQDIAEISVLKDASEAAQYGSRGAAGVIIVTTVRGGSTNATNNNNQVRRQAKRTNKTKK